VAQLAAMDAGELLARARHRRPRLVPGAAPPAAAGAEQIMQLDAAELRELVQRLQDRQPLAAAVRSAGAAVVPRRWEKACCGAPGRQPNGGPAQCHCSRSAGLGARRRCRRGGAGARAGPPGGAASRCRLCGAGQSPGRLMAHHAPVLSSSRNQRITASFVRSGVGMASQARSKARKKDNTLASSNHRM